MDDGAGSSWIRRTKYSHTICHRYNSVRLSSVPFTLQPEGSPRTPRSLESASFKKRASNSPQIQYNPLTNKPRSVSPHPQISVSDTFREARSASKRFSTPSPQRKESNEGFLGKLLHRDSRYTHKSTIKHSPSASSLKPFASMKIDKKGKKDSGRTKLFDHGGGKVTAVETVDDHEVDLSKLFLGLKFAHGAHSRLYHGVYKEQNVAVKIITAPDDEDGKPLAAVLEKQFKTEANLLSRFQHPNVIKFVGASRKPPVYCIVTEYLSEGSLRSYLHKLEHETLPLEKIIVCALEISRGMEYVHSQGVIHRDLKPENVLIDADFHMKIADFGVACEEASCDTVADDPGTYRWMAPEMIKHKHYGRKVDVYSFGLILWEMISGSIPYEDMNPIQAAYAVVNKNSRPPFPEDCHPAMRALIEQCWSSNPDKRPEFWQIVKVLEKFESSLAGNGTLNVVENMCFHDHKKGLLHWIQKLHPSHVSHMAKPRFN